MTTEIEQLRQDVNELREAVVTLAGIAEASTFALANLPDGNALDENPQRLFSSVVGTLHLLRRIPSNSHPCRDFDPWIMNRIAQARTARQVATLRAQEQERASAQGGKP